MNVKKTFNGAIPYFAFLFLFVALFCLSHTETLASGKGVGRGNNSAQVDSNNGNKNANGLHNAPSHICDLPVNGNSAVARYCASIVSDEPKATEDENTDLLTSDVTITTTTDDVEDYSFGWTIPEIDFGSSTNDGDSTWIVLEAEHK